MGLSMLTGWLALVAAPAESPPAEPLIPGPELGAAPDFFIRVDDTGTRIFIAEVKLTIGDLVLDQNDEDEPVLTGTYSIEVPLRSSKNEQGGMVLPLAKDLKDYFENGGVLVGRGLSYKRPGAKRVITCEVTPNSEDPTHGALRLEIETEQRVMKFDTTYQVVGDLPAELAVSRGETAADTPTGSLPAGGES